MGKGGNLVILKQAAKEAFGDNHGISGGELNLLLKKKPILDATKAVVVNDEEAAWHKLLMLLGEARWFTFSLYVTEDW